ncbi:MAG: hypothetical protein JNL21_24145 [Myxococcales bacterium]|nr:hypothetical protein [Myxococcales bacterium]
MRFLEVGLALAALATTLPAHADRQTLGLTYVTPTGEHCPTQAELRARVARELGYDPFVAETGQRRTIGIHIERASSFTARLVDRASSGEERARELSSSSGCSDLVDSVVLAIAVALDPEVVPAPDPPVLTPAPQTPPPAVVSIMVPVYVEKPRPPPLPKPAPPDRLRGLVSAAFGVGAGFVPGVSVGPALAIGLRRRLWEVAIEGTAQLPGTSANALGSVDITSAMGSFIPCYTPRVVERVHAMLCGNLTLGGVFLSGDDALAQSFDSWAVAAFTGPRAGATIALSSQFDVHLVGEVLGNLAPIEATIGVYETSVTLYQSPPVAGRALTAISVSFP